MLTRLFSNISLQSALASVLAIALLAVIGVYIADIQEFNLNFGFFSFLIKPILVQVLYVLIVAFSSIAFASIINSLGIMPGAYQITVLFGIQLLIFTVGTIQMEIILAIPLLVLAFHKLFKIGIVPDPRSELFDIGVITGIISLFLIEGLALIFICWAACLVFRALNVKTLLVPIIGVFALYSILFVVGFFFTEENFSEFMVGRYKEISLNVIQYDLRVLLSLLGVILVSLAGIAEVIRNLGKAVVFKRQIMSVSIGVLIIIIGLSLIQTQAENILFMAVFPISILQYNLLLNLNKWWQKDLVYLVLLANLIFLFI